MLIQVEIVATCVLVKPNPFYALRASKGTSPILTFYGDGIVPGETTIKIFTLSGELVDVLDPTSSSSPVTGEDNRRGEITWSPSEALSSGIYIYTYDSPKERGVGKFTVIGR